MVETSAEWNGKHQLGGRGNAFFSYTLLIPQGQGPCPGTKRVQRMITATRSSDVNGPTAWMKHLKEHGPNKADGPASALANISGPAT